MTTWTALVTLKWLARYKRTIHPLSLQLLCWWLQSDLSIWEYNLLYQALRYFFDRKESLQAPTQDERAKFKQQSSALIFQENLKFTVTMSFRLEQT